MNTTKLLRKVYKRGNETVFVYKNGMKIILGSREGRKQE